jgi:FlaG/FlaF family flagellin (archaellin)
MRQHRSEEGVSEVIGVMLLVGVTVLAVAIVAVVLLSGSQPDEIPRTTIVAGNKSGSLILAHEGGDPLRKGEYRIYVDIGNGLVDRTDNFTEPESGVWSIGGNITYKNKETLKRVVVTAVSGGTETILAEPDFVGGGGRFSPDPVEPGMTPVGSVTSVPTPEEIIVSPSLITDIGEQEYVDFAAKIERDDIVRVDLAIYNYDTPPNPSDNRKITSVHAYEMTKSAVLDYYYNRTLHITGSIGKAPERLSITIIAYNATGIAASQSVLATIQAKQSG